MAYQVTLRMQNGVERDVACYGYECHIAHSDRPDIFPNSSAAPDIFGA